MSATDVNFFLILRNQIKLYHWQTHSYPRHKATDAVVEALDASIDKYVEVYMGSYGARPKLGGFTSTIKLQNMSESSIIKFIKRSIAYLEGPLVAHLKSQNTDLINIRDEMLGELNQLLYLFTLH
jgi:hypothetical protein